MANNLQSNHRWRRILSPLLLVAVLLLSVSSVLSALRGRPAVDLTRGWPERQHDATFRETLATVNGQLASLAADQGLELASQADNLSIARRISLALVGSGLALEEIRALEALPREQQISRLTDYLLRDRRWAEYFAERFVRAFVGTDQGPFLLFRRGKLNQWLADQFDEGNAYDKTVRSLISARGLWTDTPQVNFVTATITEDKKKGKCDPVRLAGRTSRAFLAQRIDCLQCHDDFLGELNFGTLAEPVDGTQWHFHGLAAFFDGTALADPVFRGITDSEPNYRVKLLGDSSERRIEPDVPFQPELLPSEGRPRARLAAWLTHEDNRAFARATVNRVWALLFSRPLVSPVDSIPLGDSVPAVLDTLADDFTQNKFNLRRLVRLIVASDAFQRDSRADFEITEQHERAWAVFPVTQLRPDQVAHSLFQACRLTTIDNSSALATRLQVFNDEQDFMKRFGDRGEDEFASDAVTISQRLVLMNGKQVAARTKHDLINNAASRIATLVADDSLAVELCYLSVLNRRPSVSESDTFQGHLSGLRGRSRSLAMGDLVWAMVNSSEFSWNH